jgi:hypothetical protein
MTAETTPAGWVVQLTTLGLPVEGKPDEVPGSTFQFFNVAEKQPEQAIEIARKTASAASQAPMRVVRPLSSAEIGALRLRPGQAQPA